MNVLVVESPAKAKTINKYLGGGYKVLASFGHIRDLPSKDGSVKPDEDFAMVWDVDAKAESKIKDIANAVKGADKLILATDPDREGEAISWHVLEVLKQKKALGKASVERVVFNAVTKNAVLEAIAHPRQINVELVDAYLARRALDYLVGFTLSPVLWRKLPGARSAGRVQSVALRLVCEREIEIDDDGIQGKIVRDRPGHVVRDGGCADAAFCTADGDDAAHCDRLRSREQSADRAYCIEGLDRSDHVVADAATH